MIHIISSNNSKIGSRLIRWGTKQFSYGDPIPSHVAILVKERWVLESTLFTGVRIISYSEWKKINVEVDKVETAFEYKQVKQLFKQIQELKYDWLGIAYFSLQILRNKITGAALPEQNAWESPSKYFCCEVIGQLYNTCTSMSAPVQLMDKIKGD